MASGRVVGLCGGLQMLGASIRDTHGADGRAGQAEGLGLLNVHTDLSGANCLNANLGSANLKYADLSHIYLVGTNLSGVDLTDANLSGARFSADKGWKPANGLTQAQLDEARANPDNPPHLEGVVDAKTGKRLFWRGRPLKNDADGDC